MNSTSAEEVKHPGVVARVDGPLPRRDGGVAGRRRGLLARDRSRRAKSVCGQAHGHGREPEHDGRTHAFTDDHEARCLRGTGGVVRGQSTTRMQSPCQALLGGRGPPNATDCPQTSYTRASTAEGPSRARRRAPLGRPVARQAPPRTRAASPANLGMIRVTAPPGATGILPVICSPLATRQWHPAGGVQMAAAWKTATGGWGIAKRRVTGGWGIAKRCPSSPNPASPPPQPPPARRVPAPKNHIDPLPQLRYPPALLLALSSTPSTHPSRSKR